MGVIRHRFLRVGPSLPCDLGKSRVAQPVLASHASYDTDGAGASVGKHAVACQGVVRLRDEGYFVGSVQETEEVLARFGLPGSQCPTRREVVHAICGC